VWRNALLCSKFHQCQFSPYCIRGGRDEACHLCPLWGTPNGVTSPLKAATRIGRSHYSQRGQQSIPCCARKVKNESRFFSIDVARQDGTFSKLGTPFRAPRLVTAYPMILDMQPVTDSFFYPIPFLFFKLCLCLPYYSTQNAIFS